MKQQHELELRGCATEPLMDYLKGLGIFRIVSEQMHSAARAWWQNDTFYMRSNLDRESMVEFFLHEYRPTPIVSPWNGGSGFNPRDNSRAMDTVLEFESPRFQLWHDVIALGKQILAEGQELYPSQKPQLKEWVLSQCRARFPDEVLDWLDAAYVLTTDGPRYAPLLGTGGNDGRLEFSNNYMQNIVSALNLDERRGGDSIVQDQLLASLYDEGSPRLIRNRSTGFYNPGGVGGANASVGFNDAALTNPWDYVLMFEGAISFAGAAARRLSPETRSKALFPFTVNNSAAGYGTSSDSEYGDSSRAEFWAPLWERPTSLEELSHLISEGRAQLGRRQVSTGTDFARAVAGLGTERGISGFQRYGFLVRNGLAYLAASLGRVYVKNEEGTARRANVLFDLDPWLDSLRRNLGGDSAPAGLGTALSQIDGAIIEFCQQGQPRDLQAVLIAVGKAERWLSTSRLRSNIRPPYGLSWDWLSHLDDGSPEFRLARALASILQEPRDGQVQVGPIRENLEPVSTVPRPQWNEGSTAFVWAAGNPLSAMLEVLERRCLDGRMNGLGHPPLDSMFSAQLTDIAEFLNGTVDIQRMVDLAFPMSFLRYRHRSHDQRSFDENTPAGLPLVYAALKLTLLPGVFVSSEFDADVDIWMEPSILTMLRTGRVEDAYRVATRRLRASGLRPLSAVPGMRGRSESVRRLAASLLFPLDRNRYRGLANRALQKPPNLNQ